MKIEIGTGQTEKFFREILNFRIGFRRYMKKPTKKVRNEILRLNLLSIFLYCLYIVIMILFFVVKDVMLFVCISCFFAVYTVVSAILSANYKKEVASMKAERAPSILIVDKNGVEFLKDNVDDSSTDTDEKVFFSWNNIRRIIINNETISISGKGHGKIAIFIPSRYKPLFLEAMGNVGKTEMIIDNIQK